MPGVLGNESNIFRISQALTISIFCYFTSLQVREPAEAKAGRTFSKFEAKLCATQLVNGINYFVKVGIFENEKKKSFWLLQC